ncbi:MAG: methyl-accepting chemotaxis protein [Treponema sp.]|jgi:uncharacterized coiled-coil DUF342 family protein|nr:methyl-accepting chemotaxis protein [Treponema sp.]
MFRKSSKEKTDTSSLLYQGVQALLAESRRLLNESASKDLSVMTQTAGLPPEIKEILDNLSGAVQNYQNRKQYEILKYNLANKALKTGLWDMEVVSGDPVNPDNTFVWSDELRRMLGFTNEKDFPNKLNSWSDRLHPEDKDRTINAFISHLSDRTGKTPYNLENRLRMKTGEYRYFHALGDTVRDKSGAPLRVAGLLMDIDEDKKREEQTKQVVENIKQATSVIDEINSLVHTLDAGIDSNTASVHESSALTEKIVTNLKQTSEISKREHESIKALIENASRGQESMRGTIQSIQDISQLVDGISQAIAIISGIAANTNLLSMNAAIEAAHAGDAGKGFAVVAGEIRRLSDTTRENSITISRTLKNIIGGIGVATKQSGDTDVRISEISNEIDRFAQTMTDLINTFNELAVESSEIINAFNKLKEQSAGAKAGYNQMLIMTAKLNDALLGLNAIKLKK